MAQKEDAAMIWVKPSSDCYVNGRYYVAGEKFQIEKSVKLPPHLKETKAPAQEED